MAGLTAEQIIESIANDNGVTPEAMRQQIELALQNIWQDKSQPHSHMLQALFPNGKPSTEELVVALEYDLYDALIPKFPGWEWDGCGYWNTSLRKKRK